MRNEKLTVENTSDFTAKEISQVYVRDVFSRVPRPEKELKAFVKTELKLDKDGQFS